MDVNIDRFYNNRDQGRPEAGMSLVVSNNKSGIYIIPHGAVPTDSYAIIYKEF